MAQRNCPTCEKNAISSCWNTHLGWCPSHQSTFTFKADLNATETGPACPTCLNAEWQATEAYSGAQADSMAASQALKKAKTELEWAKKYPGRYRASSDAQLLLAVGAAETALSNCEVTRRTTYNTLSRVIEARKASQTRLRG